MQRAALRLAIPAIALVLLGATAAPAYAATWTAKIGTLASGSGAFLGSSGSVTLTDTTTTVSTTCSSTSTKGAIPHLGSGLAGTSLLATTSSVWSSCMFGSSATLTQTGNLVFNATSYASGISTGTMSGWNLAVSTSFCTFRIVGTSDASYDDSNHLLLASVTGGPVNMPTISAASAGCNGLVVNGDHVRPSWGSTISAYPAAGGVVSSLVLTSP